MVLLALVQAAPAVALEVSCAGASVTAVIVVPLGISVPEEIVIPGTRVLVDAELTKPILVAVLGEFALL